MYKLHLNTMDSNVLVRWSILDEHHEVIRSEEDYRGDHIAFGTLTAD